MKNPVITLAFVWTTGLLFGQEEIAPKQELPSEPPVEVVPEKSDEVLDYVDEIAEYPGGQPAMREFLQKNIRYPQSALDKHLTGKCYLKFVVNKNGQISNVTVARGVPNCPECDKEAIRVVKMMPKWSPGKNNGKPVNSYFHLPIAFQL